MKPEEDDILTGYEPLDLEKYTFDYVSKKILTWFQIALAFVIILYITLVRF